MYSETPPISKATERSVVARIAMHLAERVEQCGCHHVDVDYERVYSEYERKQNGKTGESMAPDLIIHRRHRDDGNVLTVEFKLDGCGVRLQSPRPYKADRTKIRQLVDRGPLDNGTGRYELGACVVLGREADGPVTYWWYSADDPDGEPEREPSSPKR